MLLICNGSKLIMKIAPEPQNAISFMIIHHCFFTFIFFIHRPYNELIKIHNTKYFKLKALFSRLFWYAQWIRRHEMLFLFIKKTFSFLNSMSKTDQQVFFYCFLLHTTGFHWRFIEEKFQIKVKFMSFLR